MNVTFEELRRVKHALPTGSITRLAQEFNMDEEAIRNYFGGGHYKNGQVAEFHLYFQLLQEIGNRLFLVHW